MSSYCLYLVSDYPEIILSQIIAFYRGEDVSMQFTNRINIAKHFSNLFSSAYKEINMTSEDEINFKNATHCWLCEKEFKKEEILDGLLVKLDTEVDTELDTGILEEDSERKKLKGGMKVRS